MLLPRPRARTLRQVSSQSSLSGDKRIALRLQPFKYRPEILTSLIDQDRNFLDRSFQSSKLDLFHPVGASNRARPYPLFG